MLPTDLLINRRNGDTIIPKRLPIEANAIALVDSLIACFASCVHQTQAELNNRLKELEGESPNYRVQRGLAHLLRNHFATFEIISPLEPACLRKQVFSQEDKNITVPQY
ncbi:MAG: DUF790 family protein [Cyanobacteria bacterium J083]|nr:MAG: DUF790 family protein [Cyanobacteria bacterium J083]